MPTSVVLFLVGLVVFFILLFGAIGYIYVVMSRKIRDPEIKGPALIGTARVLSIAQTGNARVTGTIPHHGCRIALSVQIPGRAPYEVTIVQYLDRLFMRRGGFRASNPGGGLLAVVSREPPR
jgi:hypothetical protein